MDRWQNKVAVVTGASSGIGAACVRDLLKNGLIVVGLARRKEKIDKIKESLPGNLQKNLHAIKCDVTNETEVINIFKWIDKSLGGADILINNAGVVKTTELVQPGNTKEIKQTLDTNVMGVLFCTREAFSSMKARNVNGHVVVINSLAGHHVGNYANDYPSFNIYPASKHAITAMTETYRQEFAKHNTKIKISSISPGATDTEIFPPNMREFVNKMPLLRSEDVSDAIIYVLGTPPHVQIHELTIKPLGEIN